MNDRNSNDHHGNGSNYIRNPVYDGCTHELRLSTQM